MSGPTPYLDIPVIYVPLPDSPLSSQVPIPEPMAQDHQSSYVHDFTSMLEYMNQNQIQFKSKLLRQYQYLLALEVLLLNHKECILEVL